MEEGVEGTERMNEGGRSVRWEIYVHLHPEAGGSHVEEDEGVGDNHHQDRHPGVGGHHQQLPGSPCFSNLLILLCHMDL